MERKRLIVNADGYGFTPGVNRGIIDTFKNGFIKSTSCTPNFGNLDEISNIANQFNWVSFGIHFNLSVGKPVSSPETVRSLINEVGEFHGHDLFNKIIRKKIAFEDMITELTAQAATLADRNIKITHFDGHQNKHLYPQYFQACLHVAKLFNIKAMRTHNRLLYLASGPIKTRKKIIYYVGHPVRLITHVGGKIRSKKSKKAGLILADRLITPGYLDSSHKTFSYFWKILAQTLPPGISEIYCHPGYPDDMLRKNAKYVEERAIETKILTDSKLLDYFKKQNIDIISFHDLINIKLFS